MLLRRMTTMMTTTTVVAAVLLFVLVAGVGIFFLLIISCHVKFLPHADDDAFVPVVAVAPAAPLPNLLDTFITPLLFLFIFASSY